MRKCGLPYFLLFISKTSSSTKTQTRTHQLSMTNAAPYQLARVFSGGLHAYQPNSKLCTIRSRCTLSPKHTVLAVHRPIRTPKKLFHTPTAALAGLDLEVAGFPCTDRFHVLGLHHVEFWCADAASAAARFSFGLGIPLAAQSLITSRNTAHASHVLRSRSGSLAFLFTAPYARHCTEAAAGAAAVPSFSADTARRFTADHGLAVRAIAVRVSDAAEAFSASVNAGARPAFPPVELGHGFVMAEVELCGDAVLRFVSYPDGSTDDEVAFMPGFKNVASSGSPDFGLARFDHIACGVPELAPVASYIADFTGFHEISNFTGEKVATEESALNGLVLADNSDTVLLTLLEPVHGTKRRSQVQTFLDHHGGPGVQHLAIATDDLLGTLRQIRARSSVGGFELLPPPPPSYYDGVRRIAGDVLSEEQIKECQEMGVYVDRDDSGGVVLQVFTKAAVDSGGVVLQVFTKAAVDRPTLLLEFIQRIECVENQQQHVHEKGGYGSFAKDNVNLIFKAIEDYDKTLDTGAPVAS